MTGPPGALIIDFMSGRGRRVATPADFKAAMARRIRFARDSQDLDIPEIARLLSKQMGRKISADTYRKWETVSSSIPLDAILPFCDITKTHPFQLLAKPSSDELAIPASTPPKTVSAA